MVIVSLVKNINSYKLWEWGLFLSVHNFVYIEYMY